MRHRLHLAALLLLLSPLPPSTTSAQSLKDDARVSQALHLLERWLDAERAYDEMPALSMAVIHDQELLWSAGFGHAHPERPATPRTMYSICSISKLFTSIAVMQQRDAGKLRLDDPLDRHLAWFDLKQSDPESPPITVRGILTHSAGLPREADIPYWADISFPDRERIIERLSSQETLYPAQRYFQYSNLGLTLAGELVTAVSGQPYADYVRSHVLDPLGLRDTHTDHVDRFRGERLATGYSGVRRDGTREPMPPYHLNGIAPAAGFISTVEDLGRFASWQFRLLENGGTEVLKATTLREMHRVQWVDPDWETTWGLGFSVWRNEGTTFVGHGGYCPGYQSHLLMAPRNQIATVFMTNTNGVSSRSYTQRAYEIVAPAVAGALEDSGGAKRSDPALSRYVGRYDSPILGEWHVIPWEDALAMVRMPTDDPLEGLMKLRHQQGSSFRRVRDDGVPGEEVRFETGPDGEVVRVWRHANYAVRVR